MAEQSADTLRNKKSAESVPIWLLGKNQLDGLPKGISAGLGRWIKTTGFTAKSGETSLMGDGDGQLTAVLFGMGEKTADGISDGSQSRQAMTIGKLARELPAGDYHFEGEVENADQAALSWLLGGYVYDRYKTANTVMADKRPRLTMSGDCDLAAVKRQAEAVFLTRDLVNTPANDLGPENLEKAFRAMAKKHRAGVSVTKGDALLKENFPMIHAVGRASSEAPRLLDMKWGRSGDPKITLVGKGVCFDSGGLNIKPGSSMGLMKKDMGGAANVMGLASMVMAARLPIRLRVLIPAVENAISADAYRPSDILPSRKGLYVEIGNTDAEGRLVLADALALADEEAPEILIDMATLTGAARVALGPDLPPMYTSDDDFAGEVAAAGLQVNDPVWRMPLWQPYDAMLSSKIADVSHITSGGFAGSVTAAMFLARFVERAALWAHFDIFAWAPTEKPWVRVGGEAQAIRAIYEVLSKRYSG